MSDRISLRRDFGCRKSSLETSFFSRSVYALRRKNQFFSSTHSSVRVGCRMHFPSTISLSCLNASQPTQYQPAYDFS